MLRRYLGLILSVLSLSLGLPTAVRAQAEERAWPQRPGPSRPGTLISADPVRDTPPGMQAWRILYRTSTQDGAPIEVSGMVIAPREAMPSRPRRVIAWAHGAWGVAQKCGPSISPLFFSATPALDEMIRRGYVVVAPDYPGLSTPGTHGFLVGVDTARSVLDAVRAAQGIPGAAAGSTFALWGESQGGHAVLWTASEARAYAPDLRLVGTAAAAPPTDLVANLRQGSEPNVRAMLTSFAAYSWSQRFGLPLSTMFNASNQGIVTRLAQNNCITLGKTPRLGTVLGIVAVRQALKRKDIGSTPPWSGIARENSVDPARVEGPLLVAQSDKDAVVAPTVTRTFVRSYCRLGKPLRFVRMAEADHAASARESAGPTLDWIAARFAGERLPNDCGRI